MTSLEKLLAPIEQRLKAATPGPWRWMFAHPGYILHRIDPSKEEPWQECEWILDGKIEEGGNDCNVVANNRCDLCLIENSPTDLSRLIAVVRAQDKVISAARDVDYHHNGCGLNWTDPTVECTCNTGPLEQDIEALDALLQEQAK